MTERTLCYVAIIDAPSDDTICVCGDCGLKEDFSRLAEIDDCYLTPGDPSPAGRCSDCGSLSYILVAE